MIWTAEAKAKVSELWDVGLSCKDIGIRLGTTKNSIVGQVHRMQLPPRGSPIRFTSGPRKTRASRQPVHREVTLPRLVSLVPPPPKPAPVIVVAPPPPRPTSKARCEWLDGHRPSFIRCEAMTMRDSVYCHAHSCRAYRSMMVQEEAA